MPEQNKAVFQNMMSALNSKDLTTLESVRADDFVDNDAMPGMATDRAVSGGRGEGLQGHAVGHATRITGIILRECQAHFSKLCGAP